MENKEIIISHLLDVIDKLETDYRAGYGFYDDYDGEDGNGEADTRNTLDLLTSLKAVYKHLKGE